MALPARVIDFNRNGQYNENVTTAIQNNFFLNIEAIAANVAPLTTGFFSYVWETVNFSNQVGLNHAIMGYRLLPSDVCACPKLPQFNLAKEKLDCGYSVIISGEPGCGKSITAYQIAYEYFLAGWNVKKLVSGTSGDGDQSINGSNDEKTIFIVDDAQNLNPSAVEQLKCRANTNTRFIFTYTHCRLEPGEDVVLFTLKKAVEAIYNHYFLHKSEIEDLVRTLNQRAGRRIGSGIGDTPIEFALKAALRENTPWLFNYSLRGGWGNTNQLFEVAKEHDRADIILVLICVKQIMSLDKEARQEWLTENAAKFNYTNSWCAEKIAFLSEQNQIVSSTELRAIHMEMAKKVIATFLRDSSNDELSALAGVIQQEMLDENTPLLGLVWLFNGLLGYDSVYRFTHKVFMPDFVTKLLERCMKQDTSEDRKASAFCIESVLTRHTKVSLFDLIEKYSILSEWFETVDSETAYSYAQLLNGMINESHSKVAKYVQTLNLQKIMGQVKTINSETLYVWACFIDRLCSFCGKRTKERLASLLPKQEIHNAIQDAGIKQLGGATDMLWKLNAVDKELAFSEFHLFLPNLKKMIAADMNAVIENLSCEISWVIFGIGIFAKGHPSKAQQRAAEGFAQCFTPQAIANYLTNGSIREWDRLVGFWSVFVRYTPDILQKAFDFIDFVMLDERTHEMWGRQPDEFLMLIYMLSSANSQKTEEWIYAHANDIQELSTLITVISPRTAEFIFNQSRKVLLIWEHRDAGTLSANAVSKLSEYDSNLCSQIIDSNIEDIRRVFYELSLCTCSGYYHFWRALIKYCPEIIDSIVETADDVHKAKSTWDKMIREMGVRKTRDKELIGFKDTLLLINENTKKQELSSLTSEYFEKL